MFRHSENAINNVVMQYVRLLKEVAFPWILYSRKIMEILNYTLNVCQSYPPAKFLGLQIL